MKMLEIFSKLLLHILQPRLFGQPAKLETLWLSLDLLDFCFQISWISDVSAFPDATFLKMRKWRIKERHCAENSSWSSAVTSNIYPNTIPFHPGKEIFLLNSKVVEISLLTPRSWTCPWRCRGARRQNRIREKKNGKRAQIRNDISPPPHFPCVCHKIRERLFLCQRF